MGKKSPICGASLHYSCKHVCLTSGQNNWNAFGCDVSEKLLIDTAQSLVHLGLRDLGYNYVVLDDCWSDGRDSDGYLIVDKERFPNGMNYISNQLHEMGLLYGMYSSAGELTCARYGELRRSFPSNTNPSLVPRYWHCEECRWLTFD